jgi:8-oxo-dGTP pyrophosphatase MutT (NUDIX family)
MGAGVIPFGVHQGEVRFLLHKTFSGRREGYLVDFGGGGKEGESYIQTAVREFIEETDTMYFCDDLSRAVRSEQRIGQQTPLLEDLFDATLEPHPHWRCRRDPGNKIPPKDWISFFIDIGYREIDDINAAWEADQGKRFKKRRELVWLGGEQLLSIYQNEPTRLWKRVRQLQGAPSVISDILTTHQASA